jgi:hypothetical protein
MQQNPDRDYPIIDARRSLLAAQEALAAKPTPYAALEVQDKRQRWDAKRKLELVKKKAADEERS